MFVNEDLKTAVAEAEEFEKNSKYKDLICLKESKGSGVHKNTLETALDKCSEYLTEKDKEFYRNSWNKFSRKPKCCLPKGHSGRCYTTYDTLFGKEFAKKIHDCIQAPGNTDYLFKNRSTRTYPFQVTKKHYTKLNAKYKWKGKDIKLKAAMPVEHSGTNFTIATALFDFAAIMLLQKGIRHTLPKDVESSLLKRSVEIVKEFEDRDIDIVDQNGQLCCPVLGSTLEPEWYLAGDSDPNQIQFGHVDPIRSDKYMTRGGNVVPITRNGNLMQSDKTILDTYADQEKAVERRKARRLSRRT